MRKLLIGFVMLLTVGVLSAQQFNIQFTSKTPFVVGQATLPAGTYQIRLLEDDESTFECAAVSGAPSVLFEADPHEVTPTETGVTFAKYGDKLVLKNISIAGQQGYFIPTSIAEKHVKKGSPKPTKVAVAAAKS